MRHQDESAGDGSASALSRNVSRNAARNDEPLRLDDETVLAKLVELLVPLLPEHINRRHKPAVGPPLEDSSGERKSELWGAHPEHQTIGASSPVCDVQEVAAMEAVGIDVDRFYRDLIHEIGVHAQRGGTGFGAAAIVKRVARDYGLVVADHVPLPRPTRAERAQLAWDRKQAEQ